MQRRRGAVGQLPQQCTLAKAAFTWGMASQGLGLCQPKAWEQRPSFVFLYLLAYRFASVFSPVVQPSKLEHVRGNVMLETCDLTGIKAWELRKGNRYFSPALEHEVRHIKEPPFGTKVA